MMIMIIIISVKHAIRDFCNLLTGPQTAQTPTDTLKRPGYSRVQITCNTSSTYHMQHVVYHMAQRNSSAIKFDRVEIAYIVALSYWLKPLTNEGGEETRVPRENP